MIQRLRDASTPMIQRYHPGAWVAFCAGIAALLAHLTASDQAMLGWISGLALLAVLPATHIFADDNDNAEVSVLLAGFAFAIGLFLLPADDLWVLWLLLAGFAVLPQLYITSDQQHMTYAALVTLPALLGGLLTGGFGVTSDEASAVIAGLLLLSIGQMLIILLPAAHHREKTARSITMNSTDFTETQDMRIPLFESDDLLDLSMRLHVTVDGLVRAAHAIGEVTEQQTLGANEQAEIIGITNNNMDGFLSLSERITERAREINRTAGQSIDLANEGKSSLTQAMDGMDQIRQQVQAIGSTIVTLTQLTRRIDEIITSVSEIATQSNLLALNASIEAARAGVHGRGFAVVADEVRSLAGQSTQAASQVRSILAEIQNAVKQTVSATEAGMISADEGVITIRRADKTMIQLADNVETTQRAVRSIYEVIREQANGLEEVAISVERIERITQQTLASTRMVGTVSTNLNRLADDLQQAIEVTPQANGEPTPSSENS